MFYPYFSEFIDHINKVACLLDLCSRGRQAPPNLMPNRNPPLILPTNPRLPLGLLIPPTALSSSGLNEVELYKGRWGQVVDGEEGSTNLTPEHRSCSPAVHTFID